MAVGLSQHNVALMHVVNHAFFIREPYESNLIQKIILYAGNLLKLEYYLLISNNFKFFYIYIYIFIN